MTLRRQAAVLAAIAVSFVALAPASGQPIWEHDPDDYDHGTDRRSDFWDRVVSPGGEGYDDLIKQAALLLSKNNPRSAAQARDVLKSATVMDKGASVGWIWLALAQRRLGDFGACASSLAKAQRHSANRQVDTPPPVGSYQAGLKPKWALSFERAVCEARSRKFESAVTRLKRITARSGSCADGATATCYTWTVSWRLAESLMALGRLQEAIEELEGAIASYPSVRELRYSLAVAYDRDERGGAARTHLTMATGRDRNLRSLWAASRVFVPAGDAFYYLALGRAERGEYAQATALWRAYIDSPDARWQRRARYHLAAVKNRKAGSDALIEGTAAVSRVQLVSAIAAADNTFQQCAKALPKHVFDVRVTAVKGGSQARTSRFRPGVRVGFSDPANLQVNSLEVDQVTSCLERAAAAVKLPSLKGPPSSWLSVRFHVVAR